MVRLRRVVPLLAWSGGLAVGLAGLHVLGGGPLAGPELMDPGSWPAWAAGRDPLTAVVAALRLVALGLAWYLAGVTAVGVVARVTRASRLGPIADVLTLPALRPLLHGALGLGLVTALVGADATAPPRASAALVTVSLAAAEGGGDVARGHDGLPLPLPLPLQLLEREPTSIALAERPARWHVAVAGESLWSIARGAVAAGSRHDPGDGEVHTYWRRLIEHNRDRLVDRDNPDLILPGQRFELPPLTVGDGRRP